jgi:imidazolonepropionase-like amidohydrolase
MCASHVALVLLLVASPIANAAAATPAAELATPPAAAQHFTIMSSAGKHGTSARWTSADGTRMGRESLVLRGQVFELDSAANLGPDGMLDRVVIRGFTPNGDAAESFAIENGTAAWKSPVDAGSAAYHAPAAYASFGGPFDLTALLCEVLLAAPQRTLTLLPGGRAQAEKLTEATVGDGANAKKISAYAITGISTDPVPAWVDESGKFFAFIGGLSWLPVGYEDAQPVLEKAQDDALAERSRGVAQKFLRRPGKPVAFTNVRAFLGGDHFAEGQTVVVDNGVIAQVGPAAAMTVPKNAQVIDGTGTTLVPGLWDSHLHVGGDASGALLLALGITSVRDPGNTNTLTMARAARRSAGELLSPHVYPSVLLDGKGPNTAQFGSVATTQDEAIAIVNKAKGDGFMAIKLYGTFDPAWVPATIAEAHRLGLHVHGHLPAGMRPADAIAAGYDEITHINFVMMQAMPDAIVAKSNGLARFEGPGRYAKDVDLGAEPMKSLIDTMAQKQIVSDPTLAIFENLYVPENGDLSPAYAPFVGTLPPAVERGFRQGGFAVPEDLTRADYRASFAKLQELVSALHKAGVPIVAGTDGSGLELVRELELYVAAGFTTAAALASATIVPAHLVGADKTGSIEVGKAADLVLVDGNPQVDIGDLRHTRIVMMGGIAMNADDLRAAGGFSGPPRAVSGD